MGWPYRLPQKDHLEKHWCPHGPVFDNSNEGKDSNCNFTAREKMQCRESQFLPVLYMAFGYQPGLISVQGSMNFDISIINPSASDCTY